MSLNDTRIVFNREFFKIYLNLCIPLLVIGIKKILNQYILISVNIIKVKVLNFLLIIYLIRLFFYIIQTFWDELIQNEAKSFFTYYII